MKRSSLLIPSLDDTSCSSMDDEMNELYLLMEISEKRNLLLARWSERQDEKAIKRQSLTPQQVTIDTTSDDLSFTDLSFMDASNHTQHSNQTPQKRQSLRNSKRLSDFLPPPSLGTTLATLHSKDDDSNRIYNLFSRINTNMIHFDYDRSTLEDEKAVASLFLSDSHREDRVSELASDYGPTVWSTIVARVKNDNNGRRSPRNYQQQQQLSNDRRLSIGMERIGRDVGTPFSYPLACAMTYAIQGQRRFVQDILLALESYWNSYAETLIQKEGKSEEYICETYRQVMGWCGWFLYTGFYYEQDYSREVLPLEYVSAEDRDIVIESIGLIGLKLMRWGFVDDKDFDDYDDDDDDTSPSHQILSKRVHQFLEEEIDALSAVDVVNLQSLGLFEGFGGD